MATQAPRKHGPVMALFGPEWWHHHGRKVMLSECDVAAGRMTLAGSAAELKVARAKDREGWYVTWKVTHNQLQISEGRLWMDDVDFQGAFGIADIIRVGSLWLAERYGASSATQGLFIRFQRFLNIPCPGTGHDGDPNISIELDDAIRKAASDLLEYAP